MKTKRNYTNYTNKNKTKKKKKIFSEKKTIIKTELKDIIKQSNNKFLNDKFNKLIYNFNSKKTLDTKLQKNDYYNFINEMWIDKQKENGSKNLDYLIQIDDFRVIQDKVMYEINDIISNYIKNNNNIEALELKNFRESAYKYNSIQSSKLYLKKLVNTIDELRKNKQNLWKLLALVNKNEITNPLGPFEWKKKRDINNKSEYIDYISPHNFAIFDLSAYENSNTRDKKIYKKKYKKFFITYLNELFSTTFPNDKNLSVDDVYEIGQLYHELLEESKIQNLKENKDYLSKLTPEEAIEKYDFNFTEYSKELGYKKENIPKFFYVINPSYFKLCTKYLLNEWNSEKWRSYWIWLMARYVVRFTEKWEKVFFRFYGKTEGLKQSFKDSIIPPTVNLCLYVFGPLLNNEYIDYAYNEKNIIYATNMANNLKQIFINKLKRNNWLEKKTREYAEFKIEKINIEIGSKKINGDYKNILPLLNYNPDELLENLLKVLEWRHNLYINNRIDIIDTLTVLDFKKYPAKIESNSSFLVNALYIPSNNSINVTTAYLQKPFINLEEEGTEYNLAYIGWTIAHELTHSLDNIGKLYDYNGDFKKWWSKNDEKKYIKIQKEIIKNYELFSRYDSVNKNFDLTINEDIADINGLNICEEYLRDYCILNNWDGIVALYHFRIFYLYFAYHMREIIEGQSIEYNLITNPHPLAKYRTNVPLARSIFFRHVFDIKKGDRMYSDNKIDIF
jgi:predicted metalloendopeptidase